MKLFLLTLLPALARLIAAPRAVQAQIDPTLLGRRAPVNQNHDGPKWEFVDRTIAANQIITYVKASRS